MLTSIHRAFVNVNRYYSSVSNATIFNGTLLAQSILEDVRNENLLIKTKYEEFNPKLVAIAVGNNPASKIYLKKKHEAAQTCGIDFVKIDLDIQTSEKYLLELIKNLNNDDSVNGIIVQLPIPEQMCEFKVCNSVSPIKDVDGFTQTNLGKLIQNTSNEHCLIPGTVLAVKKILQKVGMTTIGLNAVVIGRSHNVGLPIQILLGADKQKGGFDMTTTLCHRHTPTTQLHRCLGSADVVVTAAGVPGLVHANIVKPGAVVIDVGLSRVGTKVVGDASQNVREVASFVTPVPGGVGPCTVACLMHNTLLAASLQMKT